MIVSEVFFGDVKNVIFIAHVPEQRFAEIRRHGLNLGFLQAIFHFFCKAAYI